VIRTRATRPSSTRDLSPSERSFLTVLQQLWFGHLESIKIRRGALVLAPWPTVVQFLKFGAGEREQSDRSTEFELKKSMAEFFEYVRGVEDGEIRCLQIHHGLPLSMEIVHRISRGMPEHVEAV
jgi:hypothetical protein